MFVCARLRVASLCACVSVKCATWLHIKSWSYPSHLTIFLPFFAPSNNIITGGLGQGLEVYYFATAEVRSNTLTGNNDEVGEFALYAYTNTYNYVSTFLYNTLSGNKGGFYSSMYQGINVTNNVIANNTGNYIMYMIMRGPYSPLNMITDNTLDYNSVASHGVFIQFTYEQPIQFVDNNLRSNQAGGNLIYWDSNTITSTGMVMSFAGNFILGNILSNRINSIMQVTGYLGTFSPRNYFSNPEQVKMCVCVGVGVCVCVCVCA